MLQPAAITMLLSVPKPSLLSLAAARMPLSSSFKSACTDSEPVSEGRRPPQELDATCQEKDAEILVSQFIPGGLTVTIKTKILQLF